MYLFINECLSVFYFFTWSSCKLQYIINIIKGADSVFAKSNKLIEVEIGVVKLGMVSK